MDALGGWISEIRYFYIRQLAFPLSPHAQALWHWLMWKLNSAFWCQPIKLSLAELAGGTKMSPSMVKKARAELIEGGYIIHEPMGGARPASYLMLSCIRPGLPIAPSKKIKGLEETPAGKTPALLH